MPEQTDSQTPQYRTSRRTEEAEQMLHFPRIYKHFRLSIVENDVQGQMYAICRAAPQKSMPAHLKEAIPLNSGIIVAACRASAYPSFKGAARAAADDVMGKISAWITRTETAQKGQRR